MKRFWLGVALLLLLLAAGIGATLGMGSICGPITDGLDKAAAAVQAGQWEQAEEFSRSSRQRWEHSRDLLASLTSHEPMEEVDALFQALEIFAAQKDMIRFADCCARLSALTRAISESQTILWWNVL